MNQFCDERLFYQQTLHGQSFLAKHAERDQEEEQPDLEPQDTDGLHKTSLMFGCGKTDDP